MKSRYGENVTPGERIHRSPANKQTESLAFSLMHLDFYMLVLYAFKQTHTHTCFHSACYAMLPLIGNRILR